MASTVAFKNLLLAASDINTLKMCIRDRVYRHYKRWDGEQWQYGVSPKLAAAYPKGADVHTISGAYQLTVTSGATTETWGSLITLYDLCLLYTSRCV